MIDLVRVPRAILDATERTLQEGGREGLERFVLWTGRLDAGSFTVRTYHVPPQVSMRSSLGCSVRVDAPALHELNVWLFENGEILGVQVHGHPTEAYHSDTDDSYPIVTTDGGVSIVVADFGADGIRAQSTAVYRLEAGQWEPRTLRITVI